MRDYGELLKQHGLKTTFQRSYMLETIEQCGHLSIEEIYEKVVKVHPSLSLATVYKNIILMVEKGVLIEVPVSGRKPKYEINKEDHIHLICNSCGKVEDRPYLDDAGRVLKAMSENEHFRLEKQQINLYGTCMECQNKKAS